MASEATPWRPASLHGRKDLGDFLYVVVEERIDDTLGLVASPWPGGGRSTPRFHDHGEFELAVDREALQRRLSDRRVAAEEELSDEVVSALRGREIEVGDAFAIKPVGELSPEADPETLRACEWVGETIDVTAEAREAAKIKMHEALTPRLDTSLAERLRAAPKEATEPGEPAA